MLAGHKNHYVLDLQEVTDEKRELMSVELTSTKLDLQSERDNFMRKKEILRKETEACVKRLKIKRKTTWKPLIK